MSEFTFDNFLDESVEPEYPKWLNLDSEVEKLYYDEIMRKSNEIELLIEKDNESKLTPSMRKISASSLAKAANNKNRSSFNEVRYPNLYSKMKKENTRLALLWNCKFDSNKKNNSKPKKEELKDRIYLLEVKIKKLQADSDKSFIEEMLEVRRNFRFNEFQRTIDEKNKKIEKLEIQNAELQLKLRDMLRPIK